LAIHLFVYLFPSTCSHCSCFGITYAVLIDHGCFLLTHVPLMKSAARVLVGENNDRPGDPVESVTLLSREHCTARLERVSPAMDAPLRNSRRTWISFCKSILLSRELDEAALPCQGTASPTTTNSSSGVFSAMVKDGKRQLRNRTTKSHPTWMQLCLVSSSATPLFWSTK
jgi:hypothetical protein